MFELNRTTWKGIFRNVSFNKMSKGRDRISLPYLTVIMDGDYMEVTVFSDNSQKTAEYLVPKSEQDLINKLKYHCEGWVDITKNLKQ